MEIKNIINELKLFSNTIIETCSPIEDNDLINQFENKYKIVLPEDYKILITTFSNGFSLMGSEILGVLETLNAPSLEESYIFEHEKVAFPQWQYIVPFSPDGRGNFYCFDTSQIESSEQKSCKIIFWTSNYLYNEFDLPETTHESFSSFVKECIIDWTLEEYDYAGNLKFDDE
jgi:hypothetical protein